jgi:sugar/nucleoside kinase (ribokinase family)
MTEILVIGSLNADSLCARRISVARRTISGGDLQIIPGGGANQAVAAARQGARGNARACGNDSFGPFLLDSLKSTLWI